MPFRKQFKTNEEYNAYFREYRAKNRDKMREYQRKYNQEYRKMHGYKNEKNSKDRYPEKEKARRILQTNVRYKIIDRPDMCCNCGTVTLIHGHHEDYSKPLEVIWLCSSCHELLH
jgi:FtsZ-interacting cell division protein YlmF